MTLAWPSYFGIFHRPLYSPFTITPETIPERVGLNPALLKTIRRNCDLSDAWDEPESALVLEWIEEKENFWETLAGADYQPLSIELTARAVKDARADTHPEGMLGYILGARAETSLAFYAGFLDGMRKLLQPEIIPVSRPLSHPTANGFDQLPQGCVIARRGAAPTRQSLPAREGLGPGYPGEAMASALRGENEWLRGNEIQGSANIPAARKAMSKRTSSGALLATPISRGIGHLSIQRMVWLKAPITKLSRQ